MRWLALLGLVAACPAWGAVYRVGPDGEFPTFTAALRTAKDGDTIHLGAGSYFECGIISQHHLVLEGEGDGSILTDKPCEGKALLVVRGNDLTVRNLVIARVRVPDRNGAGIRLEGQGLTLDRVRFDNNEVGVLAGDVGGGGLTIRGCVFVSGGVAGDRPTAAVMAGTVGTLRIEGSTFKGVKGGQVASTVGTTELVGNTFTLDTDRGDAAPVSSSGRLVMTDNTIELLAPLAGRGAVVLATGASATLQRTMMRNASGSPATLLLDWSGSTPVLVGNQVAAGDTEVSGRGLLRHKAGSLAHGVVDGLRQAASGAKQTVKGLLGR